MEIDGTDTTRHPFQCSIPNRSYVNEFFCVAALQPKFQLSSLTTYYIPEDDSAGASIVALQMSAMSKSFLKSPTMSFPQSKSIGIFLPGCEKRFWQVWIQKLY